MNVCGGLDMAQETDVVMLDFGTAPPGYEPHPFRENFRREFGAYSFAFARPDGITATDWATRRAP